MACDHAPFLCATRFIWLDVLLVSDGPRARPNYLQRCRRVVALGTAVHPLLPFQPHPGNGRPPSVTFSAAPVPSARRAALRWDTFLTIFLLRHRAGRHIARVSVPWPPLLHLEFLFHPLPRRRPHDSREGSGARTGGGGDVGGWRRARSGRERR